MKKLTVFLFVMLMAVFMANPRIAFSGLSGNVDFGYQETTIRSGGVTSSTSTSLNQAYTFGLQRALTDTIFFSGDVRYSIYGTGKTKTESVYPRFSLNFTPPTMYNFQFSHNVSEVAPSQGERVLTNNTSISFSAPPARWPSLSLSASRSSAENFSSPQSLDTVSFNWSLGTGYSFSFLDTQANVNYSFNNATTTNNISDIESESKAHSFSGILNRAFLEKKISTNFSFSYGIIESIHTSTSGLKQFEDERSAFLNYVSNPTLAILQYDENELRDNNTTAPASPSIDLNSVDWNIGIGFSAPREAHLIHLYLSFADGTGFDESQINLDKFIFGWVLTTSADNITWSAPIAYMLVYSSFYDRFEFSFAATTDKFFRLVNTSNSGIQNIDVTEIEAFGYITATPTKSISSDTTSTGVGFGLSYAITQYLNTSYSFSYGRTEQGASESTSISQSMALNYQALPPYLVISTGISTSGNKTSAGGESNSRSLNIGLSSQPLPTINTSMSLGHGESFINGAKNSVNDSVGLSASVAVYKGVSLNVGSGFSKHESPQSGAESRSTGYSWNLNLVPWRPLNMVVSGAHSASTSSDSTGTSKSSSNSLNTAASLIATRKIYVSARIDIEPEKSEAYSITWQPTTGFVTISIQYTPPSGATGASTMGTDISVRLLKWLTVQTGYSVTKINADPDTRIDTFSLRGSVRF